VSDTTTDAKRGSGTGQDAATGREDPPGDVAARGHVGTGPVAPDGAFDSPADDAFECSYCGRPFVDGELLALHRGHAHPDRLTEAERTAFEEAYDAETTEMRRFQLKAAGAVVLLYFLLLMVYALV